MNKKTTVYVFAIIIVAAVFFGFLFLNKGDGPVAGMILSDKAIENVDAYYNIEKNHDTGVYMIMSNSFNKYKENFISDITNGNDIYATIYFVECPKGSVYIGKWVHEGNTISEKEETLMTGPKGVISYMLNGDTLAKGSYTFELYDETSKIFEKEFDVK